MRRNAFANYAWFTLAVNVGVILWGALVRATGSGAGCGNHWPDCNGAVIPLAPETATVIEFTHRMSSGAAMLLVLGLLVMAFRRYPKGHVVRRGAVASAVLILIEALLGAGLVLFDLVEDNDSAVRAVVVAVHLANTLLLLAALTLTAWWASGGAPIRVRGSGWLAWVLGGGLLGLVLIGMTGAVTALGDTLFPPASVAEGLRMDVSPTAHFLVRLRVIHPFLAIAMGVYVVLAAAYVRKVRTDPQTDRAASVVKLLFFVQILAGVVNIVLLAPVWMQLVHLLLADLVWIAMVLLTATALAEPAAITEEGVPKPAT